MRKSIIIICLLLNLPFISAQFSVDIHSQYKFKHITIDDGLSHNIVYGVCEDHYGYIWIATRLGLNRLSGTEIKTYFHDPENPYSLPAHRVYVVFCDSHGTLWVGTNHGLARYHEGWDAFIPFEYEGMEKTVPIYDITEDVKGNIWLGTENGLYKYITQDDKLVNLEKHNAGLLSTGVYRILNDADTSLWISIYPNGICSYNIRLDSIITYSGKTSEGYDINEMRVERIFKDKSGDFWFGTYNDGAYKYSIANTSFTRHIIDEGNPYSARVRVFFEDHSGKFFVGTRAGLYSYDESTHKFYLYASSNHKFSNLSANSILSSFIDHTNGLWIGTIYGGVNYTNLERKPFAAYTSSENNSYFLNNPSVFGMDEDAGGNIYVGTEGGLNILDAKTSTFTYLQHDPGNKNSLSYNDVKAIAVAPNGDFWVGTNMGGLNFYSKKKKKFTVFRNIPGDSTSLPNDRIYQIFLDSNEDLYVLSNLDRENQPSILSILRKGKTAFENYTGDFSIGIVEGPDANMYIGGQYGFCWYNKKKNEFIFYKNDSLVGVYVSAIHLDRLGNIWIGSNKGLTRYDFKTKQFTNYEKKIIYPAYDVCGILSDSLDNLWVSTNSGLFKIMGAVTKPLDSLSVRLFNKDDGLQSKEFYYNACFQNKKGEMFFGGLNGFVRFSPGDITDSRYNPRIVISGLIIEGKTVREGDNIKGNIILQEAICNTTKIKLNHRIKSFTLKYDALYFPNPAKNGFKYKLENFDNDWHYANNYNNSVTYANLPPGDYAFIIYATNNDVVLSEKPQILNIRILPAFWETLIFKLLVFLILAGVGFLTYRSSIKKFKIKEDILTAAVNERTRELNESNKELKEQKYEMIAQNEEIQTQNEELYNQREVIEEKNTLLEEAVKNLNSLNDFGKHLTSNLNIEDVYTIIEQYLTSIFKIDIIGFGVLDESNHEIYFNYFGEKGKLIPSFKSSLDDPTSLAAYCYKNNRVIVLNDFENEYKSYITEIKIRSKIQPQSVAYFPLFLSERFIGVFTIQSYEKNAFPDADIAIIQSLLSYITISVDNAFTYDIVKKQKEEIEKNKEHLEDIVAERTRNLEIAKNRAEESDQLKSAFLANMSHEIRTPLNAIIGFIAILNSIDTDPKEAPLYYKIIEKSGFVLLQIINDIIDLSKIEAGQLELYQGEIELNTLLHDLYYSHNEVLKNDPEKAGIEFKLVNNTKDKIVIETDPVRFEQILNNLLSNAIKYTHKGKIEFGIKEYNANDRILLYVKDTGIGIESRYHNQIFDRFIKIDDDKTSIYPGAGLGLSITKQLAEMLDGRIELESEIGVGSEFRFILPHTTLKKTMPDRMKEPFRGHKLPVWKNKVFLIVDDEDSNLFLLSKLLSNTGAKILTATNGLEALDVFKKHQEEIDVVLLDIKMANMDGFETLYAIRETNADVIVIAQTAYALANEKRRILEAGFNDYISKPIVPADLYIMLNRNISSM
ncbi:MAG: response regulator [Bacteroidales bacterium]|nr:response regulator [Bacteroidales bacterium]